LNRIGKAKYFNTNHDRNQDKAQARGGNDAGEMVQAKQGHDIMMPVEDRARQQQLDMLALSKAGPLNKCSKN
jgi:hypothetical protein